MRLTTVISVSGNGICLFACLFVVVAVVVVVVWRFQNALLTFFVMNGPLRCIILPNIPHDSHGRNETLSKQSTTLDVHSSVIEHFTPRTNGWIPTLRKQQLHKKKNYNEACFYISVVPRGVGKLIFFLCNQGLQQTDSLEFRPTPPV